MFDVEKWRKIALCNIASMETELAQECFLRGELDDFGEHYRLAEDIFDRAWIDDESAD